MSMSTPARGEKRSDDAMHVFFSCSTCPVFFPKLPDPRIISNFSKLPVTNPEHDFLLRNFLFVRLQITIVSRIILVIILPPMVIQRASLGTVF